MEKTGCILHSCHPGNVSLSYRLTVSYICHFVVLYATGFFSFLSWKEAVRFYCQWHQPFFGISTAQQTKILKNKKNLRTDWRTKSKSRQCVQKGQCSYRGSKVIVKMVNAVLTVPCFQDKILKESEHSYFCWLYHAKISLTEPRICVFNVDPRAWTCVSQAFFFLLKLIETFSNFFFSVTFFF